jgi:hypothetical protein
MKKYPILAFLAWLSLGSASLATENIKFHEAITESYEISSTSFDPPLIADTKFAKVRLSVFSLGRLVREYEAKDGLIRHIHSASLINDTSLDPLYGKGKNYIIECSAGSFYLVYFEDNFGADKKSNSIRFRIQKLKKISEKTNIFVKGSEGGGTSYNKELLGILNGLK